MDMNQVICSCKGVTVGQIYLAIYNGAKTPDEVMKVTGAGSACGRCIGAVSETVRKRIEFINRPK